MEIDVGGSRKRPSSTAIEDMDVRTDDTQQAEVVSDAGGVKIMSDTAMEELDPRAGDGSDVANLGMGNI